MQQHYVGEGANEITFVLHIISMYSVPDITEIVFRHYSEMNTGLFFWLAVHAHQRANAWV